MGNGNSKTIALNGAVAKNNFSYISQENRSGLYSKLSDINSRGNNQNSLMYKDADKAKETFAAIVEKMPAELSKSRIAIINAVVKIDKEVESNSKAINQNIDKELILTIQDYISMKNLPSKLVHAAMDNAGKVFGGIVLLGAGFVSVANEIGAIANNSAFHLVNITTCVTGLVLTYFGAKLINKSGPASTVLNQYKAERKAEQGEANQ